MKLRTTKFNSFLSTNFFLLISLIATLSLFGNLSSLKATTLLTSNCNERVPLVNGTNFDHINATVTDYVSSIFPLCGGSISNIDNLTDADLNNHASVHITGIGCDGTISVKANDDRFAAGTFAGFEVSTAGILEGSIASTVTIRTYLDGTLAETYPAITALVGVRLDLLNSNGNIVLGFISTQDFDEITIEYSSLLGLSFSANIYHALVKEFCIGSELTCNTQIQWTNTDFPVDINAPNTGIGGLACVGCSIRNTENIINADHSDFAEITLDAAVGTFASIAVKDVLTAHAAGTLVAFEIENSNLVDANLLSGLTVKTYLDGNLQETAASNLLLSLGSFITNEGGRQVVGFITAQPFDEAVLKITNLLGVISDTKIYTVILQRFCEPTIECNATHLLNNPSFPTTIDNSQTGISGLACAGCEVSDVQNVLTADDSDYAKIHLTADVASAGSISVTDVFMVYPRGTRTGFVIEDQNNLLQASLLNSITICTYLDDVQQECISGLDLLDLDLLFDWTYEGPGVYTVMMLASQPFNEVQIRVQPLVGLLNTVHVYNAFINTTLVEGGALDCDDRERSAFDNDSDNDHLTNKLDKDNILLYPNPILKKSGSILHLEYFSKTDQTDFIIVNALGVPVKSIRLAANPSTWNSTKINISKLEAGIYFLKDQNSQTVKRFVIKY